MTEKKTAEKNKDKISFEDALGRLEKIVTEMEGGELPLEANMKKFEEGMKLARFCTEKLGETEKKIEVLMKDAEQPQWQEMPAETKPENPEFDFG